MGCKRAVDSAAAPLVFLAGAAGVLIVPANLGSAAPQFARDVHDWGDAQKHSEPETDALRWHVSNDAT